MTTRRSFFRIAGVAMAAGLALAAAPAIAQDGEASLLPLPEISVGKADASVVIEEFYSMTCPHCGAMERDNIEKIKAELVEPGIARLVYRDFPLDEIALATAMLVRCAPSDDKPAIVHDLLVQQDKWMKNDGSVAQNILTILEPYGMDQSTFEACLADQTLQKQVVASRQEGAEMGVNATPSFVIDGKVVPFEGVDAFIETVKAKAPAKTN